MGDATGDGDGDPGCIPGELDCQCNNGQCLECENGTCVEPCILGELACECNNGQCLGGLECEGDVCIDPDCNLGELGCTCNGGLCLSDLECVGNVCMEPSGDGDGDGGGDGDDGGDPDCLNANEKMCDGECIDVMANDDACGDCGVECTVKNGEVGACIDGACSPTWSECVAQVDAEGMNCDEICDLSGETCVNLGCYGHTSLQSSSVSGCNQGAANYVDLDCDYAFGWQHNYAGCCTQ